MDKYTLTARVYPMIIFYLPLSVLFTIVVWDFHKYFQYGVPAFLLSVFAYLISQFGRDGGKKKEPKLWLEWGGAPTTQLFRWRDNKIDDFTKQKNHVKMENLSPVGFVVDRNYEINNPDLADNVFQSWTKHIIGKTRDKIKYPLIFKENVAYGFRRNLWGLKPYSIVLIIFLMISVYFYFVFSLHSWDPENLPKNFIIAEVYLLIFLIFWLFRITKSWIKVPAFAYAERIHEAIDTL